MLEKHEKTFRMAEIDCSEEKNQNVCDEFSIKSFPTMIYFLEGYPEDVFQGPRETKEDLAKEHQRVMDKIVPETKITKLETAADYEEFVKKSPKVVLAALREPVNASKAWKAFKTASDMHAHNNKKDPRQFAYTTSKEVVAAISKDYEGKGKVPQLLSIFGGKVSLTKIPRRQYGNYQTVGYWIAEAAT